MTRSAHEDNRSALARALRRDNPSMSISAISLRTGLDKRAVRLALERGDSSPHYGRPTTKPGVTLYADTWAAIQEEAERTERSSSYVLRQILDEWMKQRRKQQGAA